MAITEITIQPQTSFSVSVTDVSGPPGPEGPQGPPGAASTVPGPQGETGLTGPAGSVGVVTTATASYAVDTSGLDTTISLASYYSILSVQCDTAGIRFRVYTDTTSRSNDLIRSIETSPSTAAGVVAEILTLNGTVHLSPVATGYTLDQTSTVPIRLDRTLGSSTVNLTITYLSFNVE